MKSVAATKHEVKSINENSDKITTIPNERALIIWLGSYLAHILFFSTNQTASRYAVVGFISQRNGYFSITLAIH